MVSAGRGRYSSVIREAHNDGPNHHPRVTEAPAAARNARQLRGHALAAVAMPICAAGSRGWSAGGPHGVAPATLPVSEGDTLVRSALRGGRLDNWRDLRVEHVRVFVSPATWRSRCYCASPTPQVVAAIEDALPASPPRPIPAR